MNGSSVWEIIRIVLYPFDIINWVRVEKQARIKPHEWAFLCNGHIGETYFTCGLIQAFRKAHKNEPVVVVLPKKYLYIAKMFPAISRMVLIGHLPMGFTSGVVTLLTKPMRGKLLPSLGINGYGYKGLNFLDSFKTALYLNPDAKFSTPMPQSRKSLNKARELLHDNGLRTGKTVIIFPAARSTNKLPDATWSKIVYRLKKKGWDVATNVVGNETAIQNTVVLKFPIRDVVAVAETAGWIIALRSGICDLISSADCKRTILYPKYRAYYYHGEFKRNLNKYRMLSGIGLPNTGKMKEFEIKPNPSDGEIERMLL